MTTLYKVCWMSLMTGNVDCNSKILWSKDEIEKVLFYADIEFRYVVHYQQVATKKEKKDFLILSPLLDLSNNIKYPLRARIKANFKGRKRGLRKSVKA